MRRVLVVLAFTVAIVGCGWGSDDDGSARGLATTAPATTTTSESGSSTPSQGEADARRDGVLPAVAALLFAKRVHPVTGVSADEGRWVISRLGDDPAVLVLGDPDGLYGRDFVNGHEYGEVLLLASDSDRIIRAYPLPGLPPSVVEVTAAAVYCMRQGDGGLPDSMLCRIDRRDLTWNVRVFPSELERRRWEGKFVPPNWIIDRPIDVIFDHLEAADGRLVVSGPRGTASVDPATLEATPVP